MQSFKHFFRNHHSKKTYNQKNLNEKVSCTDAVYGIPIKRICYRGDNRPPMDSNNTGIFQIGFSKKIVTDYNYNQFLQNSISASDKNNRVEADFESNFATTVAFSRQIEAAAFFPLCFVIQKDNLFSLIQTELDARNYKINFISEYQNFLQQNDFFLFKRFPQHINLRDCRTIENSIATFLSCKGVLNSLNLISHVKTAYENKETWIYVVLIDKGFDVSSYGYLRNLHARANDKSSYRRLFAQEICSDEVPWYHVFAACKITRDFSNFIMSTDNQANDEYRGEAKFFIKEICFNDLALNYASKNWNVDVERYKKILQNYLLSNQKNKGTLIHLCKDGFHQNKSNSFT